MVLLDLKSCKIKVKKKNKIKLKTALLTNKTNELLTNFT